MKHVKLFGVALVALLALGVTTATSAFALPDVSLTLAGSSFPLHLDVTLLTVPTQFSSSAGARLAGEGFLLALLANSLTSLGTFEMTLLKVEEGTTKCKTAGAAEGVIETHGTYHIVYTSLSPLALGELFLWAPVTETCGATEFDLKGSVLSPISGAGTEGTELTKISGILGGNGKGKPSLVTYYNQGGTAVKAKLEGELGAGFVEIAEEVKETVTVSASKTNMFVITGR
jgi:hypothetical protein